MTSSLFQTTSIPIQASLNLIESEEFCKVVAGIGIGFVVTPIVLCLTPATIVGDIASGLFEAASSTIEKGFTEDARKILYNKVIASPCQQIAFVAATITSLFVGFVAIALFVQATANKRLALGLNFKILRPLSLFFSITDFPFPNRLLGTIAFIGLPILSAKAGFVLADTTSSILTGKTFSVLGWQH